MKGVNDGEGVEVGAAVINIDGHDLSRKQAEELLDGLAIGPAGFATIYGKMYSELEVIKLREDLALALDRRDAD